MDHDTSSLLNQLPTDWRQQMNHEELTAVLDKIESRLHAQSREAKIVPEFKDVFKAFDMCSYEKFKVLILGQDPYPTVGHAMGLAFSAHPTVRPLPKSLQNIYKELELEGFQKPDNGDLTHWARQGVLLLNTSLTTLEGSPNAHQDLGWHLFIQLVFQAINKKNKVIGLFWGKHAQNWSRELNTNNSTALFAPHPSPLSAYRGFFGCNHFQKTNELLSEQGMVKIQW